MESGWMAKPRAVRVSKFGACELRKANHSIFKPLFASGGSGGGGGGGGGALLRLVPKDGAHEVLLVLVPLLTQHEVPLDVRHLVHARAVRMRVAQPAIADPQREQLELVPHALVQPPLQLVPGEHQHRALRAGHERALILAPRHHLRVPEELPALKGRHLHQPLASGRVEAAPAESARRPRRLRPAVFAQRGGAVGQIIATSTPQRPRRL
mmetsp:Transcript_26121/g.83404  ORF Transcript_26121/g.83404 Transcript_26121/m.83404 type:complete len:210 (+) Transcript_26121:457-1086(+)